MIGNLRSIVLLALASIALVVTLASCAKAVGVRSPMFALAAVGGTLGFVVVTGTVLPWRLPRRLRPMFSWELAGELYRILGVTAFGALLRRPPLRYFNASVYLSGRARALETVQTDVIAAEGAHFWAFLLSLPLLGYLMLHRSWEGVVWILALSTVIHVYPSLHLRHTRARLQHVGQRGSRAKRATS
jgi:hypothetical protein